MVRRILIVLLTLVATVSLGLWVHSYRAGEPPLGHWLISRDVCFITVDERRLGLQRWIGERAFLSLQVIPGRISFVYLTATQPQGPAADREYEAAGFAYRQRAIRRPFSIRPLRVSRVDGNYDFADVDGAPVDYIELMAPAGFSPTEEVFSAGTIRSVLVPFWAFVVLLAAYPAVALVRGPLAHLARRRRGVCSRCGYDLTGTLEPKCPECGQDFDQDRQQRNRQRWERKARRAARWYQQCAAARARRMVAMACLPVWVVTGTLWLVGCWRITWKVPAFSCTIARGHLIIISQPTVVTDGADGSNGAQWSVGGFEGFSPIWRAYALRAGATLYLPLWPLTVPSAALWGFIYRPFYRLRWGKVVGEIEG